MTPKSDTVGFSIMGLVTGGLLSPAIFSSVWALYVELWKSNQSFEHVHITKINNSNPIVFLLPLLLFLGMATCGLFLGNTILKKTGKRGISICGAAVGGIFGASIGSFLFTAIECYRQSIL